ncbi:phage holin family protein [Hyphomonas sp.]|jgi:hypothetical protein|uniref:phage holin family protein n=1 Tax=Hyphomonas sp. TaxID=87 RepID=UPI0025C3AE45|nr:phage holin family protein [Hyphomonas sp.]
MRLLPLLSSLLSVASLDVGGAVSRRAKGLGYALAAGLFLFTAYVLAVGALAFFLAERMSPWAALSAVALGFIGMAAIVYLLGVRSAQAAEARAKEVADARQKATLSTLSGLAMGGGSAKTLIIAALAGLLAGGLLDGKSGKDD